MYDLKSANAHAAKGTTKRVFVLVNNAVRSSPLVQMDMPSTPYLLRLAVRKAGLGRLPFVSPAFLLDSDDPFINIRHSRSFRLLHTDPLVRHVHCCRPEWLDAMGHTSANI